MSFLFGPVNSRRLGRSLGVDLVPHKTCTYNCLYCEVGPTTHLTIRRQPFHVADITAELQAGLPRLAPMLDVVTLAGSGEPTLNAGIAEIIAVVKDLVQMPVAVLTNGSLLHLPEVRQALGQADIILPTLATVREDTFRRLHRPHPGLSVAALVEGLLACRRDCPGRLWVEVMVLKGINDSADELAALKEVITRLDPDKVQLNTAVRPVADAAAQPVTSEELAAMAAFLGGPAEVIASFHGQGRRGLGLAERDFLAILARRPMTAPHLAEALGLPLEQVHQRLNYLQELGLIAGDCYHDEIFYRRCQTTGGDQ